MTIMEIMQAQDKSPFTFQDPNQQGPIPSLIDLCIKLLPNKRLVPFGVKAIPTFLPTTVVKDYDHADTRYSQASRNRPAKIEDINQMGGQEVRHMSQGCKIENTYLVPYRRKWYDDSGIKQHQLEIH
jgi:hypothetical protein